MNQDQFDAMFANFGMRQGFKCRHHKLLVVLRPILLAIPVDKMDIMLMSVSTNLFRDLSRRPYDLV
jgi:hypothetical protein